MHLVMLIKNATENGTREKRQATDKDSERKQRTEAARTEVIDPAGCYR